MELESYDSYAGNILFGTDGSLLLGPVECGRVVLGIASQNNCGADLSVLNLWWALLKVHWGFWGGVKNYKITLPETHHQASALSPLTINI